MTGKDDIMTPINIRNGRKEDRDVDPFLLYGHRHLKGEGGKRHLPIYLWDEKQVLHCFWSRERDEKRWLPSSSF